ncbi:MAG: helix-turn-helix domain-containing protein [Methanoregula sp.]|jgi:transposase-like protein|nr:helix-turn-helix domain-containing protein [Methanoregula sp.]
MSELTMAGRKPRYDPKRHPAIALSVSRKGKTNPEIADALGIVESTLAEWRKKYPEFSDALKEGKAEADSKVEASLFQRANGYDLDVVETTEYPNGGVQVKKTKKHIPPDTTAQIFWLKNRRPDEWRDRQQLEHSGPEGGPILLNNLSDEEVERRAREILAKRK